MQRGELLAYHNEWVYLTDFLGITVREFLEPKPGIPPTPGHIQHLLEYIKANGVRGIIQASFYPQEAAQQLAKEAGIKQAVLCQSVGELPECASYLELVDYNVRQISKLVRP